eukprot:scaffold2065_cov128-Ochromonas_danica.AAC.1
MATLLCMFISMRLCLTTRVEGAKAAATALVEGQQKLHFNKSAMTGRNRSQQFLTTRRAKRKTRANMVEMG